MSGPRPMAGTLQLPFPSAEMWHKRLAEPLEGSYSLVADVDGEVIGNLGLETSPARAYGMSATSELPYATTGREKVSGRR